MSQTIIHPRALAQVVNLNSLKSPTSVKSSRAQKAKTASTASRAVNKLQRLKEFENSKKWKECAAAAPLVMNEEPTVAGWVLNTWLICSRQWVQAHPQDKSILELALAKAEKSANLFLETNAKKTLRDEFWKSKTALIELALKSTGKKNVSDIEKQIQSLSSWAVDREQKAKVLSFSGELAFLTHQPVAAEVFYQESLDYSEVKAVRDRLSSVQLALNRKKVDDNGRGSSVANSRSDKAKPEIVSEGEQKFLDRFAGAQKNNDLIALLQDTVVYVNSYPNGRKAKWASEKMLDIYSNFSDEKNAEKSENSSNSQSVDDKNGFNAEGNVEKYVSLREKALSQLEKLDASRAFDLARILHRKNDYQGSLRLAEKAMLSLSSSPQASQIYYVAGRSAQFLGLYKKAQKYFSQYLEWNSAGDDVAEVSFRLALVYYRQTDFSSSIAILEKLLANGMGEKYELGSRYWLIRALQSTKNERAEDEIKKLFDKFPLTYYGLKLKAERQALLLEPLAAHSPNGIIGADEGIWMTSFQKQNWDRALLLGANGWVAEAFQEISEMNFPASSFAKIKLAQELQRNHLYWTAIKLTNEALDLDPQLRSLEYVSLGFPVAYEAAIQAESERYRLSPWLVKSLIRQESAYNERATSVSKAMGLMQLIPPTAQEVAKELGLSGLELPEDSYLPAINLQMGTYYIARMIKQFGGNVPMGLAAYNAGPAKMQLFVKARPEVERMLTQFSSQAEDEIWIDELPWSETSFYVKAILRNTILYRLLILQEGAPPLKLEKVLWRDLAPDLRPPARLDVGPDSQGAIKR